MAQPPPATQLPVCVGSVLRASQGLGGLLPAKVPGRVLLRLPQCKQAWRRVQQPRGSRGAAATAWLGTAPKIAWGFPFLVCREQGSSMGVGTRQPLFATKGVGEGGNRESREPSEKPRTVARPGFPGAPHLVSKGWGGESFFLQEDRVCLRMSRGHFPHSAIAQSLQPLPA